VGQQETKIVHHIDIGAVVKIMFEEHY